MRPVEFLKLALLVAFLASGLLVVWAGGFPFWVWCVLAAMTLLMLYLPRFDPYVNELVISEAGVERRHGPRLRRKSRESVRWDQLAKVVVVTNDSGPFGEDMVFLLHGAEGSGVAVPGSLAHQYGLVAVLQQRLSGFRNEQLIAASGSVEPASFTLWEIEAKSDA